MIRFLTDGRVDSSFGNNGILIKDVTSAGLSGTYNYMQASPDSLRILVSGYITDNSLLGKGTAFYIKPDGKILVAGTSYNGGNPDFVLVRYNTDGSLDNTFGD